MFLQRKVLRFFQRTFHISRAALAKKFIESENDYGYRVLQTSGTPTLVPPLHSTVEPQLPAGDFSALTTPKLFEIFEGVANYCRLNNLFISESQFDPLIDEITSRSDAYNFDELSKLLQILLIFPVTPSKNTRNHCEIWTTVEDCAFERMTEWSAELKFKLADLFYQLNLGRSTKYTFRAARRIGNKADHMSKEQLLHLIFLLNVCRKPIDEMTQIEMNLLKIFDTLNVNEVALLCMGFFKTQSAVKSEEILEKMYKILKDNIDHIEDIPMVAILKTLRYSSKLNQQYLMKELLDAITPQIPRFSLLSCVHISLLGTDIQQCHEASLQIILHRFIDEIKSARMKDIERILFILGLYDYETPDFKKKYLCDLILQEILLRTEEVARHPLILSTTLSYLALNDVPLPMELVSTSLNQDFLDMAYGKNYFHYGREVILMDSYAEIFYGATYTGNRLKKSKKDYLCNMSVDYLPERKSKYKLTKSGQILLEVFEACEEITGNAKMCHPLPHFQRPDVVVAVNTKTNEMVNIANNFPTKQGSTLLTRDILLQGVNDAENVKLVAVVIGGWNLYVRNTEKVTGLLKNKLRHLEKVGFEVLLINWERWPRTQISQSVFIKKELDKLLKEKN